jgi:hypothetical protein
MGLNLQTSSALLEVCKCSYVYKWVMYPSPRQLWFKKWAVLLKKEQQFNFTEHESAIQLGSNLIILHFIVYYNVLCYVHRPD